MASMLTPHCGTGILSLGPFSEHALRRRRLRVRNTLCGALVLSLFALSGRLVAQNAAKGPTGVTRQPAGMVAADSTPSAHVAADTRPASDPLFTNRDALIAGGFVLGTVAMFPIDRHVAQQLQNPDLQAHQFFNRAAKGFEFVATPGSYLIGGPCTWSAEWAATTASPTWGGTAPKQCWSRA